MNKLFTKVAALSVGLAMAVGVGVGLGVNSARSVKAANLELTFDLSSNPGGWPTASSAGNYTYTIGTTNYTFALGANVYCNSGYLMLKYTTSLGLPAVAGYKLTNVVASNSGGCSTSTKVGVSSSSSSASYISGGAIQTWSTTSSSYTYNLSGTAAATMYYLYITNKNCQITGLALTYEPVASDKLATPVLTFNRADNTITWAAVDHATSYELKVDSGSYSTQSSGYSVASVSVNDAHTVSVRALASGYTTSDDGTLTFHRYATKGTSTDPYTVADARRAIDNTDGVTNVYATGIVTAIPTAYNAQYSNITFNLIDEGGTDILQAYRCTGTDAPNVTIGDTAVVYGSLTKHSSTYEFSEGCTLISLVHPTGEFTISFDSDGGTDPEDISRDNGETFTFPGAGTKSNYIFTGWSSDGGTNIYAEGATSPAVTGDIEYTAIWQTKGASTSDPYTVTEARAAITSGLGVKGAFATGIVSEINTPYDTQYHNITFSFSVDGTTTNQLKAYRCTGTDAADVTVGDTVIVHGNLTLYNSTDYQFSQGCILDQLDHPVIPTYTVTYTAGTNGTGSFAHVDQPEGSYSLLPFASLTGVSASSGYRFKNYTVDGEDRDPGYTFTLSSAKSVTVNFEEGASDVSVSTVISEYATAHSWVNQTQYTTLNMDSNVTVTVAGGANSGKYYTGDSSWRIYSSESGTLTITVPSGCTLVSATLTFLSTDSPTVTYGGNGVTSGTAVALSGTSAVFSVTAGKLHLTDIAVVYSPSSVSYTITYNNNGGSGTMSPTTGAAPQVAACEFTAPAGLEFSRWNTASDGTGVDYAVGATASSDITLYAIWVTPAVDPSEYFTQITSTSDITNGKYLIVYDGLCFDGSLDSLDAVGNTKEMNLTNLLDCYFTISSGHIQSASGKYIGQNSDSNGLTTSDTALDNTVSIDASGNLEIVSSGGAHLRYNSASNQLRFRYYKSSSYTSQQPIQLYKVNLSKVILNEITCNAAGTSQPTGSWTALENYYNTLSTTEKSSLVSVVASESGTDVQKAMAKYDYIVGKYGTATYKDFIGRNPAPISGARIAIFGQNGADSDTTLIIVIASVVAVAAVGGYFFLRRKKEQ